jgi:hypothetical protein
LAPKYDTVNSDRPNTYANGRGRMPRSVIRPTSARGSKPCPAQKAIISP